MTSVQGIDTQGGGETTRRIHELIARQAAQRGQAPGLIDGDGLGLKILDWRYMVHGPLIILAIMFAYRQFNRPKTADFLIETENELKNKVTWPSRKEEVSASIVVVVTVLILSVFIFGVDYLMKLFSEGLFYPG